MTSSVVTETSVAQPVSPSGERVRAEPVIAGSGRAQETDPRHRPCDGIRESVDRRHHCSLVWDLHHAYRVWLLRTVELSSLRMPPSWTSRYAVRSTVTLPSVK